MDDKRKKELYAQLRMILMELLWDKKPFVVSEPRPEDGSVLRIHASESIGTRERVH